MTLGLVSFILLHYSFLLLLVAASFALGSRLTQGTTYATAFEQFVVSTTIGLGALGTATFLLGIAGLLYAPVAWALLLASLIFGYGNLRELGRTAMAGLRQASRLALALGVAVLLAGSRLLLLPLYPPTQWDSTSYHLAVAGIYAREHATVFTPYLRSPVFPQLNELLFTLGLLIYDDIAAQMVQIAFLLLSAATLYCWARRFGSPLSAGLWGAAIWISSPLVMMLGSTGYVEIALTCFLTLGAYAFVVWYRTRERAWLLIAAAALGFAEGVKYIALFAIMIAGLVLLYRAARERFSKTSIKEVLAFTAMVIAVAGPWHARITWYAGNPIWPYGAQYLGSGPWPLEHIQTLLRDQFNPGVGTSFKALLLLPWNLSFNLEKLFVGELVFTPVIFYLLPLALGAVVWNREVRLLLALTAVYTLFWFYTAQNARYLVHAVPLMCLAAGMALAEVFKFIRPLSASVITAAVVCVLLALPGFRLARVPSVPGWIAMPSELPPHTEEQRDSYIAARIPEYPAIDFLNKRHQDPYTLYSFPGPNLAGYVNGTFVGDWYGPARYIDYLASFEDPGNVYSFLRSHKVDYLLLSQTNGSSGPHSDQSLLQKFLNGHLKLIYAEDSLVFEVSSSTWEVEDSPELLRNPELEEKITNGVVPGWTMHGSPQLDTSGKEAFGGTTTLGADSANWLEQTVPVHGGAFYVLRAIVRPTEPNQYGLVEVNWLDRSGASLRKSTRFIIGPVDWLARATGVTAPVGAVAARIRGASTGPELMWFDYFSFRKLSYKQDTGRESTQ